MTAPDRSRLARERLSRELRRLREEAGVPGNEAARRIGISQSKVSKIESGRLLPSVADVERLLDLVEVPPDVRAELVELARRLNDEAGSRRVVLHRGPDPHQLTVTRVETRAKTSRLFHSTGLPALLHTDDYLRGTLTGLPTTDRDHAVAALHARRAWLDDPSRRFVVLLTEGALRWQVGSAGLMREQIDHLRRLSRRPHVHLGVLPWTTATGLAPAHDFQVYDDRVVTVAVLTGNATLPDTRDVRDYLDLFVRLDRAAVRGPRLEDLLARISGDYRRLAQAGTPRRSPARGPTRRLRRLDSPSPPSPTTDRRNRRWTTSKRAPASPAPPVTCSQPR